MNFNEMNVENLIEDTIKEIRERVDGSNIYSFGHCISFDGFLKIAMLFWQNNQLDIAICCPPDQMYVFMNKEALGTGTVEFSYLPDNVLDIRFLNNSIINCTFMNWNEILIINCQNNEAKLLQAL